MTREGAVDSECVHCLCLPGGCCLCGAAVEVIVVQPARATARNIAHVTDKCPSAPDDNYTDHHQCMKGERRCVYCAVPLHPYPCHGCNKFMTAQEMHEECGNTNRCEDCR
jgi:hypothetical protein